jgi:hypothetical protein
LESGADPFFQIGTNRWIAMGFVAVGGGIY